MKAQGAGPKTLSASGDTLSLYTYLEAGSAILHAQSSSSLVVTVEGTQDGDEWVSLPCRLSSGTVTAAGSNLSLTTDNLVYIPAEGMGIIRVNYVSGSGEISMRTSHIGYADAGSAAAGGATDTITTTVTTTSTTYTAGDVLGTVTTGLLTFAGCARSNGSGGVVVSMTFSSSILAATPAEMEIWLFDASVQAFADSAAFAPSDAEAATCIGVVELSSAEAFAGTLNRTYHVNGLAIPFRCAATSTSLYAYAVVRNAYTPGAAETLTCTLGIIQD